MNFQNIFLYFSNSLKSLNTLFILKNLTRLIYESIKAFKIRTSTDVFYFFPCNIILLCFLFFFFIIDLFFLIHAVNTRMFNYNAELAIITKAQTNEVNGEIETQPGTYETRISKCTI